MDLKDIPKLLWILLPPVFYLLPYFSEVNGALSFLALLPYAAVSLIDIHTGNLVVKPASFVLLVLFMVSNTINFYYDSNTTGLISSPVLFLFLITSLSTPGLTLKHLDNIVKRLFTGLVLLFVFIIFLPCLANFSYKLASWYYIAADTFPFIRTTLDGPFCLVIIPALICILMRYRKNNFLQICIYIVILGICFYTLLVFNRRTLIIYFLLFIPFIFRNWVTKPLVYKILFIASFILPVYFALFLFYANEFFSIPIIHEFTLRSGDLNAEDNKRLLGWIKAITAFQESSMRDFFKFHKVLVRSRLDRYNHFHNGYIQMYYEQGIFGFTILVLLIISLFKKIKYFRYIDFNKYYYLLLCPVMFALIILLSVTESVFRDLSLTNIFFIISCFLIIRTSELAKAKKNMI